MQKKSRGTDEGREERDPWWRGAPRTGLPPLGLGRRRDERLQAGLQHRDRRRLAPSPSTSFRCTPPLPFGRCINRDGERASAEWQKSRRRLPPPANTPSIFSRVYQ